MALTGDNPQTYQRQVLHVTRSGTTYTATPLDGVMAIGPAVLGRGAYGAIVLAVRNDLRELAVAELNDGVFVRDDTVPMLDDQPAEWSVTVGPGGTIRVLALLGNYTLRTGSQLVGLKRQAGTWSVAPIEGVQGSVTRGIVSASGPLDAQHIAYFARRTDGLFYTRPGSSIRLNTEPGCDEGNVRMAIDADDQPHLLYDCDGGGGRSRYIAPVARYSDAYGAACQQGADTICDRACACGSPDCCYNDGSSDGSNGCTFGPGGTARDLCVTKFLVRLCGDLTAQEAPVRDDCMPALDTTDPVCLDNGYTIPDACWPIIQSNF